MKALFKEMATSVDLPNFRVVHHRQSVKGLQFDHLPDNPQDFVIAFDSTGIKLTNCTALVP
ncbi:MAG: hypothetical protein N3D14_02870 [Aquificaceae bacterium]|nr:hypothetical protein [Aquificaceae bacterium]